MTADSTPVPDGTDSVEQPSVPKLAPDSSSVQPSKPGIYHNHYFFHGVDESHLRRFRQVRPPSAIVRGGTTSSAYDSEMAQRLSEADQRRAQDAAERHLGTIPIEQGGALNFERKLADPAVHPMVLLQYVGWGKEVLHEQLCELVFDDLQEPPAHILVLVCPECFRRGVPVQFAQMHVRDNHRSWAIDTRAAGQMKAVKNQAAVGGIEFYHNAGKIMDTDILRCDGVNCGTSFKINKNFLYRVR